MSDHPLPTHEQFAAMNKDDLIKLLLMALEAQQVTTKNMAAMNGVLARANEQLVLVEDRLKDLDSKNKSQEAELIMLRAK
jgi:hypothetical protein